MTIVNIVEEQNLSKYLVITQQKDPSTLITTRVLITDNANNKINLINVERGPQGETGLQGIQGLPGKDGVFFDILPVSSGGTNSSTFANDKIIYFDGSKLTSSIYSIDELISSQNAITGIVPGTGLSKIEQGSSVTLNTRIGDGLTIVNDNIVVDDSIARKAEINLNTVINGTVPIAKGGTNNSIFSFNSLIYYDGNKFSSFPLATGRIVTSGSQISILAGSGLVGGGNVNIPNGSIVINIPQSSDIAVLENSIELSVTGSPGTYTKITTDTKGRVVSGTQITASDITTALGYVPWNMSNDGDGSGLDADLLDGRQGSYYLNFNNLTGTISTGILPNITNSGVFSKVVVSNKGLVIGGGEINYQDVIDALGYNPVNNAGDTIYGDLSITQNLTVARNLNLGDNLPEFGYNNYSLIANDPRGFSFTYGNTARKTGILAYYPADAQLKLITDIFGTGASDIDGSNSNEDAFNGDLDGGNASSVFLMGNLDGDEAIVLLEHIADQKYISLTANQVISGIKEFTQHLTIGQFLSIKSDPGYTGPPIRVGSNSGWVQYLNSDLLDNNHGTYYRNAANLTGILNYNNVTVTNLSGTNTYLPKFDNRTNNPSRTISDSIVRQSGSSLIVIEDGSLLVGDTNVVNGIESLAVGIGNKINADKSAAIGYKNIVSGDNSIALNYGSTTLSDNSVAMGKYGTTWTQNQLSIGALEETTTKNPLIGPERIAHAQHSITALGYLGSPGSSPATITSPANITVPKNKTIKYNVDLLFTKFGGSGVAAFSFTSGIIKNINDTGNLVIQHPVKQELYNDSQIREYLYNVKINSNKDNQNQILSVTRPPLLKNDAQIQNVPSAWRIKPELSEISGNFIKTFDGKILLDMEKPIFSGYFFQNDTDYRIKIKSYDHSGLINRLCNITYVSGINGFLDKPISNISGNKIIQIINNHEFTVADELWSGSYVDDHIFITNNNLYTNNFSDFNFSGILNSGSSVLTFLSNDPIDRGLYENMVVGLSGLDSMMQVLFSNFSSNSKLRVSSLNASNNTAALNYTYDPENGDNEDLQKTFPFRINSQEYSIFKFENAPKIYIQSDTINMSFIKSSTELTSSGLKIYISDYFGPTDLTNIKIGALKNNTGILTLNKKRSYQSTYERQQAVFPSWNANYFQQSSSYIFDIVSSGSTNNLLSNTVQLNGSYMPGRYGTGYLVSGEFIPSNTTIVTVDQNNNVITLSNQVTLSNDSLLYFANPSYTLSNLYFNTTDDTIIDFVDNYSPYIIFHTAFNSFSGTLVSGLNIINNCVPSQIGKIIPGMRLFANTDGLNYSGIVSDVTQSSITMDTVFSGISPNTSRTALITYYGALPPTSQYYNREILYNGSGFLSYRGFSLPNSGIHLSGAATLYPTFGSAIIQVASPAPSNFADNEITYLDFQSHNAGLRPVDNNYITFNSEDNKYSVMSLHLKPDSGIPCGGNVYSTFDRDHGYVNPSELNNLTQQIPLVFNVSSQDNQNRTPLSNVLDIIDVSGHQIVVDDSKYTILKEDSKPRIYDKFINSVYRSGDALGLIIDSKTFQSFYTNDKIIAFLNDDNNNLKRFKIEETIVDSYDNENYNLYWNQIPYNQYSESYPQYITFTANIEPPFNSSKYKWPDDFYCETLSSGQSVTKGIVTSGSNIITNCFPELSSSRNLAGGLNVKIKVDNKSYYRSIDSIDFVNNNVVLGRNSSSIDPYIFGTALSGSTNNLPSNTVQLSGSYLPGRYGVGYLTSGDSIPNNTEITVLDKNTNTITLSNQVTLPDASLLYFTNVSSIHLENSNYANADIAYSTNISNFINNSGLFAFGPLSPDGTSFMMYYNSGSSPPDSVNFISYINSVDSRLSLQSNFRDHGEAARLAGNIVTEYKLKSLYGFLDIDPTGTIRYLGYQDGSVHSPINNCYFHSYGNISEYWKRDDQGNYIDPPSTGVYRIYHSDKLCESGTLCVHISGINNFANIHKDQTLFFDFLDTSTTLTGIFTVNDKIDPQVLTIDIPYNPIHVNNSGVVYVIDSKLNIKTDKNPNLNNAFIRSSASNDIDISNTNISSYNLYNNRWKHCLSLSNSGLVNPTGSLNAKLSVDHEGKSISNNYANIIVLNQYPMSFNILYSLNDITYSLLSDNQNISANIDQDMFFKIAVSGGAGGWSNNISDCVPRIKMLGVSTYTIEDILCNRELDIFGNRNDQWVIKIKTKAPTEIVNDKNIQVFVADESGREYKNIKLDTFTPLTVTEPEEIMYGVTNNSTEKWRIAFEVYGGNTINTTVVLDNDDPNAQTFFDAMTYTIENSLLNNPNGYVAYSIVGRCKSVSSVSSPTIFYPKLIVSDSSTTITKTLTLHVESINNKKPFSISLRAFKDNISIDRSKNISKKISFLIPLHTSQIPDPGPTILIGNKNTLNMSNATSIFIPELQSYYYSITVPPANTKGYYDCSLSINNLTQPSGSVLNAYSLYSFATGVGVTIYNPITIDTYRFGEALPISSNINNRWILNLEVLEGASSRSVSDRDLKVYLANTPNIGRFSTASNTVLDYDIKYSGDPIVPSQIVSVTGKSDIFSEFAASTGNYPVFYYLEDYTSYATGIIPVRITGGIELKNISSYKYATINNGFDFNFDITQPEYLYNESAPSIDFDTSIKDPALPLNPSSKKYSKYDPHTKVWEYFCSCAGITDKWDAMIQFEKNNLNIKVNGLSTDKIYVAGKLDTIETENLMFLNKPFGIKSLTEKKEIKEGGSWDISVTTSGGIESDKYPPQIILTNTPTSCTGYDPSVLGPQSCSLDPVWNPGSKEWSYKFVGDPLCVIGEYKVGVEAIDKIGSEVYGTASSGSVVIYESGADHPGPSFTKGDLIPFYPNCVSVSQKTSSYKINERDPCPRPTGISGFFINGSLPPGLSYTNTILTSTEIGITGGYITINGSPTTFASGGNYSQEFTFGVIDYRGLRASGVFTFQDGSAPMEPSPTDMTVYFASSGYAYSPSTGTKILESSTQDVLSPPAVPFSMKCLSKLPHNKCPYFTGVVTTVFDVDNSPVLFIRMISGSNTFASSTNSLEDGDKIYLESDEINLSFWKEYSVFRSGNPGISSQISSSYLFNDVVYLSGNSFDLPDGLDSFSARVLNITDNMKNKTFPEVLDFYEGKPESIISAATSTGIMGSGSVVIDSDGNIGLLGRIKPSRIATVKPTGYSVIQSAITGGYKDDSKHHESFNIVDIPSETNINPYVINLSNCYETGQIRVSGVIVPKLFLDFTDAPPGESSIYSSNASSNGSFSIQIRSAYGETYNDRAWNINYRDLDINYSVINEVNQEIYNNNNAAASPVKTQGIASINFDFPNNQYPTPAIFGITISYDSLDEFPTFKRNSIPSVSSVAYWVHSPDGSSFPPVIPLDKFDLVLPTGVPINKRFQFAGGFIGLVEANRYSDNPPKITGYIQDNSLENIIYSGNYYKSGNGPLYLKLYDYGPVFATGDALALDFLTYKDKDVNTISSVTPSQTGIIIDTINPTGAINGYTYDIDSLAGSLVGLQNLYVTDFNFTFVDDAPPEDIISGIFLCKDLFQIYMVSDSLNIRYNNSLTGIIDTNKYFSVGSGIDLIQYNDPTQSLLGYSINTNSLNDILISGNQITLTNPDSMPAAGIGIATIDNINNSLSGILNNKMFINNTGLCFCRKIINEDLYFIKSNDDVITDKGYSTLTLTGQLNDPFHAYLYRVITSENFTLSSDDDTNKKYGKDFNLYVTTYPRISNVQGNYSETDNTWDMSFSVTGGYIPRSGQLLEVEINNNIHTFVKTMYEVYDSGVVIGLQPKPGYTWTLPINLSVFDSIGYDNQDITFS